MKQFAIKDENNKALQITTVPDDWPEMTVDAGQIIEEITEETANAIINRAPGTVAELVEGELTHTQTPVVDVSDEAELKGKLTALLLDKMTEEALGNDTKDIEDKISELVGNVKETSARIELAKDVLEKS